MSGLHKSTILTVDGEYFDFAAPGSSRHVVTLNAIARGLANTCRFAGQCARFYSVAQHSVIVSHIVPPEFAIDGLFHDAAEAFVGDMPKPLKVRLPDYQAVEDVIERVVFGQFGLSLPLPSEVKVADKIALATEQRDLMKNRDDWYWTKGAQPLKQKIVPVSPERAYRLFMARADELGIR